MPGFRVLIIESDAEEAGRLRDLIRACAYTSPSGCTVPAETWCVDSFAQARSMIGRVAPNLVLFGPASARVATAGELRQLRQQGGLAPIPILFVQDLKSACAGEVPKADCDDIVIKPYNPGLMEMKLASIRRFRDFNRSLITQRDRLRRHHADFLQEQANAREIFGNLGNESCLDDTDAIRYHLSPRAVLNGDLLAATYTPDGKLVLMLADFAGHGLAAAVGAVPLTSIFYSMMPRGFSFSRVLREMNRKLFDLLPRQMFCCLVMLELDPRRNHLRLLNAGMPSPCLVRADGAQELFVSRHLPLGVLADDQVDTAIVNYQVRAGDRLFLWSDGIHEARNLRGEHFGEERLLALLRKGAESGEAPSRELQDFDRILVAVNAHAAEQHDDLSLVELDLSKPSLTKGDCPAVDYSGVRRGGRIGEWSIEICLAQEELREADPLPHLLSVLVQMPGAVRFREDLAIALGELFRNAMEHGVLGLDSSIKNTDEGFVRYYDLLEERRQQLDGGWIRISLRCDDWGGGGELQLQVEDSGSGFPPCTRSGRGVYSGRGLAMLRTVCRNLEFSPGSSLVRAVIAWGDGQPTDGENGGAKTVQTPTVPV
ncbi:ATP-binding SpoIIE family protein phosphatase [Microbulbifer celer]|uniref:SpoIIE family protein phosphatase n=1 Tax=Microbulbifer celer TaxID=435905 RepID=A0ABW3UBT8_9GAMM|nr:ATP-binding SpoIIE family protein phosphatase [Microbulbifer celer]UFN59108.1 SpoIIE family protein phosphatase [Microbulbifer celer]